jgi:RHS repeat-associated protein
VLGLDGDGALAFKASYDPWGTTITGDDSEGRGYTGQYKDENGLLYLHARFYDPTIGRFISPDPMISSARPIGVNRYAYAFNDPVNNTDIDGLGFFADAHNWMTGAAGTAADALRTTNVVDHLEFFSKELGLGLDVKKVLGDFNWGIGNSLALIFYKFHALGRGDYAGMAKAWASESLISIAVAATIVSYGTAYAPLVSVIVAVRLPFWLTLI